MSGKFVFLSQFYVSFRKMTQTAGVPFKEFLNRVKVLLLTAKGGYLWNHAERNRILQYG